MGFSGESGSSVIYEPSGDQSGVTDTAEFNAIIQSGMIAQIVPATYYVKNLLVDTYGGIVSPGPGAILQAVSGTTGYMIAKKNLATTKQINLRGFTLIPNTGSLGGISLLGTGWSGGNPDDQLDNLEDLLVLHAGGDAYHLDSFEQEARLINCKAYENLGYGFYLGNNGGSGTGAVDTRLIGCTAGNNASHGFYVLGGTSCDFVACKGFGSGWNYQSSSWGTTQNGFEIASGTEDARFTGCTAQQNALHGFDLNGCQNVALAGCNSNTNSAGAAVTTGVGVNINGAPGCTVIGTTGGNEAISPGAQKYGLQVSGTNTGTLLIGNSVTGTSGPFNYVSGGGYLRADGSDFDLSSTITTLAQVSLRGSSAQALANGNTIALNFGSGDGSATVTATGAVTGLILAQPSLFSTGQLAIVSNESAFTLTFAVSGTSAVANGVSCVIQANSCKLFYWDQATNLWYPTA